MTAVDRARYGKRWKWDRAAGRPTAPVDATPVRERVLALNSAGFPFDAIATAANVSASIVERVARGEHPTMQLRTARRLAAVTPHLIFATADPAQNVPIYATRRRVQALHRIGWRTKDIDNALGRQLVQGNLYRGQWVYARTHRAIAAVYDQLHMTPGSSQRSINHAIKNGFASPLAWDDIDDPDAQPRVDAEPEQAAEPMNPCDPDTHIDHIALERALKGDAVTLTRVERHRAIVIGTGRGNSVFELATLLRTTTRTVERHRALHQATCVTVDAEQENAA